MQPPLPLPRQDKNTQKRKKKIFINKIVFYEKIPLGLQGSDKQ
jgi:hypothetical protein